jgi:SAM-dependent methyltransferase
MVLSPLLHSAARKVREAFRRPQTAAGSEGPAAAPTAYDQVEYPSAALLQAHPDRLCAVARMFGLRAAAPQRCRYLDVGCGDGTHVIACALGLPEARFVGVDLSAAAVERGQQLIAHLGLKNVTLTCADLDHWQAPAGDFDYAVSHGVYSWVPAPIRDKLLAVLAKSLTATGLACVSYNTYPGCYARRMVWEMLKYHTAKVDHGREKVEHAMAFARFLCAAQASRPADPGASAELKAITSNYDPRMLLHDELAAVNEPVYFHEFIAHADRFGLRFMAEADAHTMETSGFPAEIADQLDGMAAKDILQKEQYLDFLHQRRFRHTLLCRAFNDHPHSTPDHAKVADLLVSGNAIPESSPVDFTPDVPVTFRASRQGMVRTHRPLAKAALTVLAEAWPQRLPFAELLAASRARLQGDGNALDKDDLCRFLTACWMSAVVDLHAHSPICAREVSERPLASPLARVQLRNGPEATTLFHTTMTFTDGLSRGLVALLDGTRNVDQLVADLCAAYPPGQPPDPAAVRDGALNRLARLARLGLLVG